MGKIHICGIAQLFPGKFSTRLATVLGAAMAVAAAGGCQSKMYDENAGLHEQVHELQARLDERAAIQSTGPTIAADRTPAGPVTAAPVPAYVAPSPAPSPAPRPEVTSLPGDWGGLDAREDKSAGTITVNMIGDELFDSGKATLKETSKRDLNKIAAILHKQYIHKPVRIEGHTDSDPIKHSKWANNVELSNARADAVKKYLVSRGIDSSLITTQGFGDTKPKSTSPKMKAENRRVEIVVVTR